MEHRIPDEPRSWWLPETDPETAARELHEGLERLRANVSAYRERRMRMAKDGTDTAPPTPH